MVIGNIQMLIVNGINKEIENEEMESHLKDDNFFSTFCSFDWFDCNNYYKNDVYV